MSCTVVPASTGLTMQQPDETLFLVSYMKEREQTRNKTTEMMFLPQHGSPADQIMHINIITYPSFMLAEEVIKQIISDEYKNSSLNY